MSCDFQKVSFRFRFFSVLFFIMTSLCCSVWHIDIRCDIGHNYAFVNVGVQVIIVCKIDKIFIERGPNYSRTTICTGVSELTHFLIFIIILGESFEKSFGGIVY